MKTGVKKAALQLGLQYYTLADWRKARKYTKKHTVVLTGNEANAKICELERENAELRLANEILNALGFFTKIGIAPTILPNTLYLVTHFLVLQLTLSHSF